MNERITKRSLPRSVRAAGATLLSFSFVFGLSSSVSCATPRSKPEAIIDLAHYKDFPHMSDAALQRLLSATVTIQTYDNSRSLAGENLTGFVAQDGKNKATILTAGHGFPTPVTGCGLATVEIPGGSNTGIKSVASTFAASSIGQETDPDLAKITANTDRYNRYISTIPHLPLDANAAGLRIGDPVIEISNQPQPELGNYGQIDPNDRSDGQTAAIEGLYAGLLPGNPREGIIIEGFGDLHAGGPTFATIGASGGEIVDVFGTKVVGITSQGDAQSVAWLEDNTGTEIVGATSSQLHLAYIQFLPSELPSAVGSNPVDCTTPRQKTSVESTGLSVLP